MTYEPPDSAVVGRIQRAFPGDELRERARATNLIQRERKFDVVALFYTLAFGFGAGSERSIQAFFERYVEMADLTELEYSSFYEWFSPGFLALLREILDSRSTTYFGVRGIMYFSGHSQKTGYIALGPIQTR